MDCIDISPYPIVLISDTITETMDYSRHAFPQIILLPTGWSPKNPGIKFRIQDILILADCITLLFQLLIIMILKFLITHLPQVMPCSFVVLLISEITSLIFAHQNLSFIIQFKFSSCLCKEVMTLLIILQIIISYLCTFITIIITICPLSHSFFTLSAWRIYYAPYFK